MNDPGIDALIQAAFGLDPKVLEPLPSEPPPKPHRPRDVPDLEARAEEYDRDILALVASGKHALAEVWPELGVARTTLRYRIRQLVLEGRLVETEARTGKRGRPKFLYHLPGRTP